MALDCDGVDDKVGYGDVAAIDTAAALTVMLWVNPDTVAPARQVLLAKATASVIAILFEQVSNDLKIYHTTGGITGEIDFNVLSAGTWAHVASVFDGAGVANADRQKLYVNGVNQTVTFAGTIPAALGDGGANALEVGAGSGAGGTTFLNGKVALLKVWTAALSAAEIAQEMQTDPPLRTANLLIWSPYDDETSARDYSGNGNHGTVTGALQIAGPPVNAGARIPVFL